MSFAQVLFIFHAQTWNGFSTRSSHGISMAIAKKMMGFPSDSVSFSTKLPSKRHEKGRVTLFTGYLLNTYSQLSAVNIKYIMTPVLKCDALYFLMSFCHYFGLVREWDQIHTGNPIIFWANAMEIPWLDLVQNLHHVPAWKINKTWVNDMESSWNLLWIWAKPPPSRVVTRNWRDMEFPWESMSHLL